MRGPLTAIKDYRVERVVLMWASQTAKTDGVLDNVIGYFVDQDPSNMLMVQPREFDAKKWSKSRLAPMIRDTPCLRGKVQSPRARDSNNTILEKYFPGGRIVIAGANAPSGLAGDSAIRVVLCDEVDRYPPSAGTEGDPVSLAENRAAAAVESIVILTSTPGIKDVSRIEKAFEESDQRRYFVPCPECGEFQTLRWGDRSEPGGVRWENDEQGEPLPHTARYECENCGALWNDAVRWAAVRKGEWRATEPFNGTAGFHLNALYAPWENLRLEKLVDRWLKAQRHPELLKVFINTVLAETWEEKYQSVDLEVMERREAYPEREGDQLVPRDVVVMTAGVDLQDDRIEVQVEGWGLEEENWKLEYHVLDGDPSSNAVWEDLWELLCRPREMERGGIDYIRATAVDTGGHHTQRAYEFCRPRYKVPTPDGRRAYVFAIKGQGGAGDVWPREPSRNNKGKVRLFPIRVDPAKEWIYGSLQRVVTPGPGYIHFPEDFERSYFDQLTAEKVVTRTDKRGFPVRVWELKSEGRRNEALDTAVYSYAALCGLRTMGLDLEFEARRLRSRAPEPAPSSDSRAPKSPGTPTRRKRRRWNPADL